MDYLIVSDQAIQIVRSAFSDLATNCNNGDFDKTIVPALNLNDIHEYNTILNAYYLLEDTQLAKDNYVKYSFSGPTKIIDYGEMYLRLYGFLNLIWLQKDAIFKIYEILFSSVPKSIFNKFSNLNIIRIRNIAAAHTTNFIDGKKRYHI